ncbi:MAG: Coenzyme F420 hydrogenase/dehydrogenase, beta subunit C-terminal domain [Eubacteriales bacterium]
MNKIIMNGSNIGTVVDNALCTACGACAGICPNRAIKMIENSAGFVCAEIDVSKCSDCTVCLKVCPSNGGNKCEDLIGTIHKGYVGYASDENIRQSGQSGGIVTALLQYLLSKELIDAVVVTKFNVNELRAESFITDDPSRILESCGSHYTQTSPIELILNNKEKRMAAVLLGCQTAALEQILTIKKNLKLNIITLGLICGGNLSGLMVDDIISYAKVDSSKVNFFRYRDKKNTGWPGDIVIKTDDTICIPKEYRMEVKQYYRSYRCMLCAEKMNQCADIVVGDPWGINLKSKLGFSVILSRTVKGDELLKDAANNECIFLEDLKIADILAGQKIMPEKFEELYIYSKILLKAGWKNPYQPVSLQSCLDKRKSKQCIKNLKFARKMYLCQNRKNVIRIIKLKKYHKVIREYAYKCIKKLK